MLIHNAAITGSLTLNGVEISDITGSESSIASLNQATASLSSSIAILSGSFLTTSASYSSASGSFSQRVTTIEGKYATTGSNSFNGSQTVTGSLTVTNQIVAQTLSVQQVTSSIIFSSGSNVFGNSLSNTQQLTGSVTITGSLSVNGTSAVVGTGTTNYLPKWTSGSAIGNSQIFDNGTNVGVNESTPSEGKFVIKNPNGSTNNGVTGNTLYLKAQTANANLIRFSGAIATDLIVGRFGNYDGISIGTTGGTEIARFLSGGNVLINSTTDNGNRLQVTGTASFTGNVTSNVQFISNNGTVETRLSYSSTPAGVVGTISNHPLELYTNGNAKATISTSGNLGLGVTPSAWSSPFKVLEGGGSGFQQFIGFQNNDNSLKLGVNQYYNGSNYVYTNNGLASRLDINADKFIWNTAPSGTAGNAITFTQAMTLTANGRLLLGTTTEGTYLLDVNGSGRFSETSWITKNQNGVTSINLVNNDLNNDAGQALRFYFNTSTPLGGIIHQYNTGTSAYDLDFKVWSGFSPVTRLFLNGSTGAATFSSSVTATIFDSTSNAYRLNGNNALSLVSLGGQSVVKINAAGYWGTQLVGANDQGILINNTGNVLVGTTTDSGDYKLQVNGNGFFNSNYSAGGTVSIMTWQRNGGAVAAEMVYNDANTSMNFGTSTAHSLNLRTNGTVAITIKSGGIVNLSNVPSSATGLSSGDIYKDASGFLKIV